MSGSLVMRKGGTLMAGVMTHEPNYEFVVTSPPPFGFGCGYSFT